MNLWNNPVFSEEHIKRNGVMGQVHKDVFFDFFDPLDRKMSILELGCNIGLKLEYLKQLGFENLTGLEINKDTVNQASKRNTDIKFIHGTIEDFVPESSYDLVFTSETLIYFSPENIKFISDKIQRMAKKYIFGKEFFSESPKEFKHRSDDLVFWSNDYQTMFKNMKTIKARKIKNPNGLIENSYLLSK